MISDGDRAAMWWRTSGRHVGPYGDIAPEPTGKRITMEGVDFMTVAEDHIVAMRSFWDCHRLPPTRPARRWPMTCDLQSCRCGPRVRRGLAGTWTARRSSGAVPVRRREGPVLWARADRDRRRSDGADVERLGAPGPLANLELHRLADRQRLRTVIQHVRSVDEHITPSALVMNPKPRCPLNHLTTPAFIAHGLSARTGSPIVCKQG